MSNLSAHRHSLVNSIPQTQQNPHQSNLTAPIHPENDSVDDVVFLCTVPKVPHSPEDYDPECLCSTCKLATKLLAECTCEQCRDTEQPGQSSENVPIANAVSPTNAQRSSSSIQNNDASTSEHTNANDQDDDHSRSSTPDYLPRFFDDESGDSSSDDSEVGDSVDDENNKELDQESESEENNDNSDPDYALRDSSSDDSEDDSDDDHGGDEDNSSDNMEVVVESENLNSIVHSQPLASSNESSNSSDNQSANSNDKRKQSNKSPIKCPKCEKTFTKKSVLLLHYRAVHQEWKPYYCRWPKCNFTSAVDHLVIAHADRVHFKLKNRQQAKTFVGKREEVHPKDPVLEQIIAIKFDYEKKAFGQTKLSCPQCGRYLYSENFERHIRTHANPGYGCTWSGCGFFYSQLSKAKKHVWVDHLQVELANSAQTNQHLIKVNPKNGKTSKVVSCPRKQRTEDNNDNLEDEENSSLDDNEDAHSVDDADDQESESLNSIVHAQPSNSYQKASVTNDKLLNLTGNESAISHEEATDQTNPVKCPKCAKTFTVKHKLLRHYRAVHQEWKPYYCRWPKCNFESAIDFIVTGHAYVKHFKSQNRQKARKYVGKRKEVPPNDPVLKQISLKKFDSGKKKGFGQTRVDCPQCGRNLYLEHLKSHIRTHSNPGYGCAWPNCGFFYSMRAEARKHLYAVHLRVETATSEQTKRYLVKVNTRTGKRRKVAPRHIQKTTTFNSNCPKCSRNFRHRGHFKRHLRIHTKKGFRCTWLQCGFVYPNYQGAQKHLLKDHFKGKLVNATQISEHVIEVGPNSNVIRHTIQNNGVPTSECINDQDDHSRSSTPEYLPRLFDAKSGVSNSDDDDDDDQEYESCDNDSEDSVDDDDGESSEI